MVLIKKKYKNSFYIGIRNILEYRFNFISTLLFKLLPVFVQFYLWKTIYLANGSGIKTINGMTLNQIISYVVFIQFLDLFTGTEGIDWKVMREIKDGSISKYLLKPINYLCYNFANSIASKTIQLISMIIPIFVVILMFKQYIGISQNLISVALSVLLLIMAYILRYLISFILGLLAFWLTEIGHLYIMTGRLIAFFSGIVFPLILLPVDLLNVSKYLPFHYIAYFPVMVFIGKTSVLQTLEGLAISLVWVIIVAFLYLIIWKKGLKKYSAVGG